jgi:hypothetical protein
MNVVKLVRGLVVVDLLVLPPLLLAHPVVVVVETARKEDNLIAKSILPLPPEVAEEKMAEKEERITNEKMTTEETRTPEERTRGEKRNETVEEMMKTREKRRNPINLSRMSKSLN